MFFDDHPEFLHTSNTAASRGRLNLRHVALIEENADILRDRSVIDIASHDGRWSFAALEAGAAHVTGIEGRQELVDAANQTFAAKGVPSSKYTMITADAHERLSQGDLKCDVVMCFGFLYHTLRYVELFAGIEKTGAEYVIVDTRVIPSDGAPIVEVRTENTRWQSVAIEDKYAQRGRVMSAVPSEQAVILLLDAIGFEVDHRTDWDAIINRAERVQSVGVYKRGGRVSFRARRMGI